MLKIRLSRKGSRHRPFYRVVVSDGRRRPGSSAIEELGYYDPTKSPSVISLNVDRVEHWVGLGAKPSGTVAKLVAKAKTGAVADVEVAAEAAAETVTEEPAAEAAAADEAPATASAEPEAAADDAAAEENADAKSEEA